MPGTYVDFAPGHTVAPDAVRGWAGIDRAHLSEGLDALGALPEDWDGYGAKPVSPLALNMAGNLIDALLRYPLPPPQLVPVPNGGVQLEWVGEAIEVDLELRPDGSAVFVCDDNMMGEEIDGELPDDLQLFGIVLQRLEDR